MIYSLNLAGMAQALLGDLVMAMNFMKICLQLVDPLGVTPPVDESDWFGNAQRAILIFIKPRTHLALAELLMKVCVEFLDYL